MDEPEAGEVGAVEAALDPASKCIGFAGKSQLRDAIEEVQAGGGDPLEFMAKFRVVHSLQGRRIAPVMGLLQMAGVSNSEVAREVLATVTDNVKRKIAGLSQAQLADMLGNCFSYLTVPQMRSVGIAVLERLEDVDESNWLQIVENGLYETPYIDLPLSLKRRIWAVAPAAFDHEVELILSSVVEFSPPPGITPFLYPIDRAADRAQNKLLADLCRITAGDDSLTGRVVEKIVDTAANEQIVNIRTAFANLFHDYLVHMPHPTDSESSIMRLRLMARYLDRNAEDRFELPPLREICEALAGDHGSGPRSQVALLVASTYSRDLLADRLAKSLLENRGPVAGEQNSPVLQAAADHLRKGQWVELLTYANMCNMKVFYPVSRSEADIPFAVFFPRMMNEMHKDAMSVKDAFLTGNAILPHEDILREVRLRRIARRVVTSYALQMYKTNNTTITARFRLVLDAALSQCDDEEPREQALSYGIIVGMMEE